MNELKIFESPKFGKIRTIMQEDGKPLFCGSDVAKALGYARPNDAISQHCRAAVKRSTPISGKMQDINFIPEGDVYRLITHSKLPAAEQFESWVFDEVLPSIRKHGAYMTDDTLEKALTDPDFLIRLATELKEEKTKRIKAEQEKAILIHTNKVYTATEIAKEIGFSSARALNEDLNKLHIQFKQNGTWVLYSDYANLGYTEIKQTVCDNGRIVYDRKWTGMGREFLLKLYGE